MTNLKYLVPNGCTALSLVLGLASIALSASGRFEDAAWLILWGVLLDKLDGGFARMLDASSDFGAEMDSFADFVVFGIAPAALVFFSLTDGVVDPGEGAIAGACAAYALAVGIRLARFNVSEPEGSKWVFFGVPTTLVGGLLSSGWLTALAYDFMDVFNAYLPVALVVFGGLMVSNVRIPKFSLRWSKPVNAFQIVNMGLVYILVPFRLYPEYLLFLGGSYLIFGLYWGALYADTAQAEEQSVT
jgi:CDP-diacylglycerol--serine O-phosphatidyltransferase